MAPHDLIGIWHPSNLPNWDWMFQNRIFKIAIPILLFSILLFLYLFLYRSHSYWTNESTFRCLLDKADQVLMRGILLTEANCQITRILIVRKKVIKEGMINNEEQ